MGQEVAEGTEASGLSSSNSVISVASCSISKRGGELIVALGRERYGLTAPFQYRTTCVATLRWEGDALLEMPRWPCRAAGDVQYLHRRNDRSQYHYDHEKAEPNQRERKSSFSGTALVAQHLHQR